jgi:hypothetical protein
MKKILVVSIIIIVLWLIILRIPSISQKIKDAITFIVVASPIPPIP